MSSLISIAVTGLNASQSALTTTGNNISNASTEGYSRQRVVTGTQTEQSSGSGYMGSGVKVETIERIVDEYAIKALRSSTSDFNSLDTQSSQLGQLDSLLSDSSSGLASVQSAFFSDLQEASQDPTAVSSRQVVLSDAQTVADRYNALYAQMDELESGIEQQLQTTVTSINSLSSSIAKLNQQIVQQTNAGGQPNALLDQRDSLLQQLSEQVSVSTVAQSDGSINVFIGKGQALVVGSQASMLGTAVSSSDSSELAITYTTGGTALDITNNISGGRLGGLLTSRATIDKAMNELGRLALTTADAMNEQQRKGLDLNGNYGTDLYTDINTASAMASRVVPNANNASAGQGIQVAISDTSQLITSDYTLQFTDNAGGYSLLRQSDGAVVATGAIDTTFASGTQTISADGFDIDITSGTFQTGNRFEIQPTRRAASDMGVAMTSPSQLAFAQPLSTSGSSSNTGNGAISDSTVLTTYQADGTTMQPTFATSGTLSPPLTVQFTSATAYNIVNANTSVVISTGTFTPNQNNVVTISDGITGDAVYQFTLSGAPAAGDTFSITYNSNGSSDNRNAMALGNLSSAKLVGGSTTLADGYSQLVSSVASQVSAINTNREAADSLVTQAQANRDSVSGVNLDEEAANLTLFQQAYSANAKVIEVARSLFDTLLAAF